MTLRKGLLSAAVASAVIGSLTISAFASDLTMSKKAVDPEAQQEATSSEETAKTPPAINPEIAAILETEDAADLLRRVDELYRSDTSEALIRMKIVTPNWERTMEMQIWTKGMEKTFIRILAPKKDRGVATLKLDEEMWNYFPKIDKAIKVPPSMMMSSWMGSDFTNDDLVKEASLADDYFIKREDAETTITLTLTPREDTVTVWGKIIVVVDMATLLPVEQSYFNERGDKVRIMRFLETKDFGGRMLPSKMEMTPLNEAKDGNKTIIYYDELKLDVDIDDEIFTWRNLKKRFN